jgi:hypothetical protein
VTEKRKFERVKIPQSARVFVATEDRSELGPVRMLGRGGFLIVTAQKLTPGERRTLYLVDEDEGIRRQVRAIVRYVKPEGVGFEFEGLDADAAVEVGVIIGRHYTQAAT